jgi:hypothetical protein
MKTPIGQPLKIKIDSKNDTNIIRAFPIILLIQRTNPLSLPPR